MKKGEVRIVTVASGKTKDSKEEQPRERVSGRASEREREREREK